MRLIIATVICRLRGHDINCDMWFNTNHRLTFHFHDCQRCYRSWNLTQYAENFPITTMGLPVADQRAFMN